MPNYTVEVDAGGKKLAYDFDLPDGADAKSYMGSPEFQSAVSDAYRSGKLREIAAPVPQQVPQQTSQQAPQKTTDSFVGGIKRGYREGLAGLYGMAGNAVRLAGDIDDTAEKYIGVRPLAQTAARVAPPLWNYATGKDITDVGNLVDTAKIAKGTREIQSIANSYMAEQAKKAAELPEPTGFISKAGQVTGNIVTQAPAMLAAGAALGPVGGMAAMGAASNYDGSPGSALYGGTIGAAMGKLNVIAAPMKIGGRVLTGALSNVGQEMLLNDKPTMEGLATQAVTGGLFGAYVPGMFKDMKAQQKVSKFKRAPVKTVRPPELPDMAVATDGAVAPTEVAPSVAPVTEISPATVAPTTAGVDVPTNTATLDIPPVDVPANTSTPVVDAVTQPTAPEVTNVAEPVADVKPESATGTQVTDDVQADVQTNVQATPTKISRIGDNSSVDSSTASFLGTQQAYQYGSQLANKAAQVLKVPLAGIGQAAKNVHTKASQALNAWNGTTLRLKLIDQATPLREAEVEMGLAKQYGNSYPDFTTSGKHPLNENSSYEARRLFDSGTRGVVHNRLSSMDQQLRGLFKIDPSLDGLREFMFAERFAELHGRNMQTQGLQQYVFPGANPRTGDAGWDLSRIRTALAGPHAVEFARVAHNIRGILEAQVDEQVALGMITPQRAAAMRADNKSYVPLKREVYYPVGGSGKPKSMKRKSLSTDELDTIDSIDLRGSSEPVKDPITAFAMQIEGRQMAIERYKVVKQYLDQVDNYGQGGALGVGRELPPVGQRQRGNPQHQVQPGEEIVHKFVNGEPVEYAVPQDIANSLRMGNLAELGVFGKILNNLGKLQTHMVTTAPVYSARNWLRDYRNAKTTSPIDYSVRDSIGGVVSAIDEMFHPNANVTAAREVKAIGGSQNLENSGYRKTGTYEAPRPSLFTEPGRRLAQQEYNANPADFLWKTGKKAVRGVLVDWWNSPLTKFAQASEATSRMGLFERTGRVQDPSLGRPYNDQERAFVTQNTLTDFSMRGTSEDADLVFRTVPFLRARMIGMLTNLDQAGSLYANNPGQFLKTVAYMAIPAITIHAWNNSKFPEMEKKINPEVKDRADVFIYGNGVDEEGYANQVFVIPKEGLTASVSNAVRKTMDAQRDKDYDNYLRTSLKFIAESVVPAEVVNSEGEVEPGKAVSSVLPPSIAAVLGATQNKDIRTGKPLFSGSTAGFSRGLYKSDTKTGRTDTSAAARTLSGAVNAVAGDMQGTDPFGMLFSPVGIEQVARNTVGTPGVAIAKALDPIFGKANEKLFDGTPDYPKTFSESTKAGLRTLDPRNSLNKAFLMENTAEEEKHVRHAQATQEDTRNKLNRASAYFINRLPDVQKAPPQQKLSMVQEALVRHGLAGETDKPNPQLVVDLLTKVESKMNASSMEFDTVDYTLQSLGNRGKALFIYSLSRDKDYKTGGPKHARLLSRLKKMKENEMLTDGVMDELGVLMENATEEGRKEIK